MDAIREQLNKPLIVGVAGIVLGIILGILYGWVINPVEWTDADITHLRADLKAEYLRMAIDSYALNGDTELAKARFNQLGEEAPQVLEAVEMSPGGLSPEMIYDYLLVVQAEDVAAPGGEAEPAAEQPAAARLLQVVLPIVCVITILIAGGLVYFFVFRTRASGGDSPATPVMEAREAAEEAEWTDYEAEGEEPPMVQFMASYKIGDDLFDDSFSIDSPAGEFLGECGVGISETIGVGDPKKVTAFEVWLFDKNDIQTVTKVLMSAHAYLDESTRQRLAAKGEPVLAEVGATSVLETQTLRLVARVVDMGYGDGALPEHSFFDRIILELAIWPKAD